MEEVRVLLPQVHIVQRVDGTRWSRRPSSSHRLAFEVIFSCGEWDQNLSPVRELNYLGGMHCVVKRTWRPYITAKKYIRCAASWEEEEIEATSLRFHYPRWKILMVYLARKVPRLKNGFNSTHQHNVSHCRSSKNCLLSGQHVDHGSPSYSWATSYRCRLTIQ